MSTTTIYSGLSIYVHGIYVFLLFFLFFFLAFSLFFFVFKNISRDAIWISRNWAALKYFAFPNIATTTEMTMVMLKT